MPRPPPVPKRHCTCGDGADDDWMCCIEPTYRDGLREGHSTVIGSGQAGDVVAYRGRVYKTVDLSGPGNEAEFDTEAKYAQLFSGTIGPTVYSVFKSKDDAMGVIEMEQFPMSAHRFLTKRLGRPACAPAAYTAKLLELFQKMVDLGTVCEDLRPENFVVRLDKANEHVAEVRLIDYGGNYCGDALGGGKKGDVFAMMAMLCRWITWHLTAGGVDVVPEPPGDQPRAAELLLYRESIPYLMGFYAAVGTGKMNGRTIEGNPKLKRLVKRVGVLVLKDVAVHKRPLPLLPWKSLLEAYGLTPL